MTSTDDLDTLNSLLREVNNLEESLLTAVELTHHGYSAQLRFEHLRLGQPVPHTRGGVIVLMEAVSSLRMTGGLSETMVHHPDAINWGLSEVAQVGAYPVDKGVGLLISWEGEREIRVESARAQVFSSPA